MLLTYWFLIKEIEILFTCPKICTFQGYYSAVFSTATKVCNYHLSNSKILPSSHKKTPYALAAKIVFKILIGFDKLLHHNWTSIWLTSRNRSPRSIEPCRFLVASLSPVPHITTASHWSYPDVKFKFRRDYSPILWHPTKHLDPGTLPILTNAPTVLADLLVLYILLGDACNLYKWMLLWS